MPWLPLYVNAVDALTLVSWLNAEPTIAFIIRPEPGRLIAVPNVESLHDGRHWLWHTESGPLPHIRLKRGLFGSRQIESIVADPWAGWDETVTSARGEPWFGGGCPRTFVLNLRTRSGERQGGTGLSSFGWIGSRYAQIGRPAQAVTTALWRRLRSWVSLKSRKVPRTGPTDGPDAEIFAFPSAYSSFQSGGWRDQNPDWSS